MNECPHCEYHKQRAQLWRDEAYRLAGHPLPRKETMTEDDDDIQDYKKPWRGLTDEEIKQGESKEELGHGFIQGALWAEAKLKEKNG